MSKREQIQDEIEAFLTNAKSKEGYTFFNAPYGIITGMDTFGKGKVRVITFGVSRYLDASVNIYTPTRIVVNGQGGLAYKVEGEFKSVAELKDFFKKSLDYVTFPD
jgi:hypothetical protein